MLLVDIYLDAVGVGQDVSSAHFSVLQVEDSTAVGQARVRVLRAAVPAVPAAAQSAMAAGEARSSGERGGRRNDASAKTRLTRYVSCTGTIGEGATRPLP